MFQKTVLKNRADDATTDTLALRTVYHQPQPRVDFSLGWAAIALAVAYTLVTVGFAWATSNNGVALVFGLYAPIVFIFAGATVTVSVLLTDSADEWVVTLLFCFLVVIVVGACVRAAWRWREQTMGAEQLGRSLRRVPHTALVS